ncbi:lipopolysaccharide assembly protein LapA domain-containing protein [Pseudarthrobacter sp. NPDC058329]|uniref:lipopolysaccharide assembly protein LapA domain-containing protein n=1 Tax=Pseudarthrobacter sp. NPDC058329 TaxID=3346448 RepID=UPI0036DF6DA5
MSTGNYPPPAPDRQPEPGTGHYDEAPSQAGPSAADGAASGSGVSPAPGAGVSQGPGTGVSPGRPAAGTTPTEPRPAGDQPGVTRAGVVWAAVVAALVLLILLIIFILQNQDQVAVRYFGLEGFVPLGMALFIASVTGGVLVAVAGGARILQLRRNAHRARSTQRK